MSKKSPKANGLQNARKLASDVYKTYKQLHSFIDKDQNLNLEIKSWINDHSTIHDVYDQIALIKDLLDSKLDGRPQPIDYSHQLTDPEKLPNSSGYENSKNELRHERQIWRRWAECYSPGYEAKASIGQKEFNMKDLIQLRNWIDMTIEWHNKNPKRASNES